MNKFLFSFKMAYKNIFKNKFRSMLLFIYFILLFTLLNLTFINQKVSYFYAEQSTIMQTTPYTLKMSVGENTSTRFFSTSNLKNKNYNYSAFFKVQLLNQEDSLYLTTYLGNDDSINKSLSLNINLDIDEIIISKSYAKLNNYEISDFINLNLGNVVTTFKVGYIIDDIGLLNTYTVFINYQNITPILKSLFDLSLPLSNLHNEVYFISENINDDINDLKNISNFENLDFQNLRSEKTIERKTEISKNFLLLFYLFSTSIILLITFTSFVVLFKEKKNEKNIILSIGGTNKYFNLIWLIEVLLYLIPNIFLGYISTLIIVNAILRNMYIKTFFKFSIFYSILSFLILLLIYFIILIIFNYQKKRNNYKNVLIISLLILSTISFIIIAFLSFKIKPFIQLILIFVWLYSFLFLFLKFFVNSLKSIRLKLYLKIKIRESSIFKYFFLSLITIMTIVLMFSFKGNINLIRTENINLYKSNIVVSNINDNINTLKQEINTWDNIEYVSSINIFHQTNIKNTNFVINNLFSGTSCDLTNSFNFEVDSDVLNKLNSVDNKYIILPLHYKKLNVFSIGDVITLSFSTKDVDLVVAGFLNNNIRVSFTNIHLVDETFKSNTLFINTYNINQIKYKLIDQYQKNLYYIFETTDFVNRQVNILPQIDFLINALIIFSIIVFTFSLINQNIIYFENLKNSYTKLYLLGLSNQDIEKLSIIETLFLSVIIFIISFLFNYLIAPLVSNMFILLNDYYLLSFDVLDIIKGLILSLVMVVVVKVLYLNQIKKLDIVKTLKTTIND